MLLKKLISGSRGFTLVEVVLVVVILGILVSVSLRTGSSLYATAKVEETKQELDALAFAIVGNAELENGGVRSDFGYVGDIGAMPANLDALVSNPGGYSTWKGPYFQRRFSQITDDHRKDAWGDNYVFTAGVTIKSVGKTISGGSCGGPTTSGDIIRHLAGSTTDLLYNQLSGVLLDVAGAPPGTVYQDSVVVNLTIPDGAGGRATRTVYPDHGGYFSFDSIPVGNHDIAIVYLPDSDTLHNFVSVPPNSAVHSQYRLPTNFPTTASVGGIEYVEGTSQISGEDCDRIGFDITNTSSSDITITSVILSWSSPSAEYDRVHYGATTVYDGPPQRRSGDTATFSQSKVIAPSEVVTVQFRYFSELGDDDEVNMRNTTFTATFSDGSSIDVSVGSCTGDD